MEIIVVVVEVIIHHHQLNDGNAGRIGGTFLEAELALGEIPSGIARSKVAGPRQDRVQRGAVEVSAAQLVETQEIVQVTEAPFHPLQHHRSGVELQHLFCHLHIYST